MSTGYVYLRPLALVSVRATGPYKESSNEAWKQILDWRTENRLERSIVRGYGLLLDDPRHIDPKECRYEASVEFNEEFSSKVPDTFRFSRLPGGAYARQRHVGVDGLGSAIAGLRDGWVAAQGLTIDPRRPVIEIHLDDPAHVQKDQLRLDICIPVALASASQRPAA